MAHQSAIQKKEAYFTYSESTNNVDVAFGPSRWSELPMNVRNECRNNNYHQVGTTTVSHGFGPSPVTIDETTTMTTSCETNLDGYNFTSGNCRWQDVKLSITPAGLRMETQQHDDPPFCNLGTLNVASLPGVNFQATQLHVHLGSEHQLLTSTVNNEQGNRIAELHIVHKKTPTERIERPNNNDILVVVAMWISLAETNEDHRLVEILLQGWEKTASEFMETCRGHESKENSPPLELQCLSIDGAPRVMDVDIPTGEMIPNIYEELTQTNSKDFGLFSYKGGLTTPPCSEKVLWNILDIPIMISASQWKRLLYLALCTPRPENIDETKFCARNLIATEEGETSRPVQPLLGRRVIHRCGKGPPIPMKDLGVSELGMKLNTPTNEYMPPIWLVVGIGLILSILGYMWCTCSQGFWRRDPRYQGMKRSMSSLSIVDKEEGEDDDPVGCRLERSDSVSSRAVEDGDDADIDCELRSINSDALIRHRSAR